MLWVGLQSPTITAAMLRIDEVTKVPRPTETLVAVGWAMISILIVRVWRLLEDEITIGLAERLRRFPGAFTEQIIGIYRWGKSWAIEASPWFTTEYRQELIAEYGLFNDRGLGLINANRLDLERVYVELKATNKFAEKAAGNAVSPEKGSLTIWTVLKGARDGISSVLIGPPGSGKTTMMQHMLLILAGNKHKYFKVNKRLPFFIETRQLAPLFKEVARPTVKEVLELSLLKSLPHLVTRLPSGWLLRKLRNGRCVLMFDGLDEISDEEIRLRISGWLNAICNDPLYRKNAFIITSRPLGYSSAPLERANVLQVQPFTHNQTIQFIQNWYLANEIVSSGNRIDEHVKKRAQKEAQRLQDTLIESTQLSELTTNPLLLTMLCMVHRYHGALPGSRTQLYAEICQVLLERWRQAKRIEDRLRGDQKLTVLRPLAAAMMETGVRELNTKSVIEICEKSMQMIGIQKVDFLEFLKSIQASSGLLIERENDIWSFSHFTFQEFLTAAHWLQPNCSPIDWENRVSRSWWRETLMLYLMQTNASAIILAALQAETHEALAFAYEAERECQSLDLAVRQKLERTLHQALETFSSESFFAAAQALVIRNHYDGFSGLDKDLQISVPVTNAEFYIFLTSFDAIIAKSFVPLGWNSNSFEGSGTDPVANIMLYQATSYCEWLDKLFPDWNHKLPSLLQLTQSKQRNEIQIALSIEEANKQRVDWSVVSKGRKNLLNVFSSAISGSLADNLEMNIPAVVREVIVTLVLEGRVEFLFLNASSRLEMIAELEMLQKTSRLSSPWSLGAAGGEISHWLARLPSSGAYSGTVGISEADMVLVTVLEKYDASSLNRTADIKLYLEVVFVLAFRILCIKANLTPKLQTRLEKVFSSLDQDSSNHSVKQIYSILSILCTPDTARPEIYRMRNVAALLSLCKFHHKLTAAHHNSMAASAFADSFLRIMQILESLLENCSMHEKTFRVVRSRQHGGL